MDFASLLDSFSGIRALVVGDVMLDEYIFGTVDRISPEAPVMVVKKTNERCVPGGAANVAKNVVALGGRAHVVGTVGTDSGGDALRDSMSEQGLGHTLIPVIGRPTTRKTRVVANHSHQVLRIDDEVDSAISADIENKVLVELEAKLPDYDLLILSDYRKGLLTERFVSCLVGIAKRGNRPVFANAKPESAAYYAGATLVSLNRSETARVTGERPSSLSDGEAAARRLCEQLGVESVLVTMGELGMAAGWGSGGLQMPAPQIEAYDVAGAGDTVLATVALGVKSKGFDQAVFALAAATSAKVVRHVGVAVPTTEDLEEIRSRS
ncbi:bifunctional ADP-heptose synthase [Kamptonema cortianum]|nr:bifunctional ADP-heptose synthase [Geitlerinema splendidum]MDK3162286.1 bifunctional ADP-heptose synthase [Kamptonema cortianum]